LEANTAGMATKIGDHTFRSTGWTRWKAVCGLHENSEGPHSFS
jgi:hypothetical protein